MSKKTRTIDARSGVAAIFLVGIAACASEEIEPTDAQRAAEVEQQDSIAAPTGDGVANQSDSDVMASSNSLQADFNGDGYADLAIGVPGEDLGSSLQNAGAVNVLYGTREGLSADDDQLWTQDSSGVSGSADPNDNFGWSLAAGDFDGDGYADLAISAPFDSVGSADHAGAVHILYGSRDGLRAADNQRLHQDTSGMRDKAENDDLFGLSLTSGDFDGDGYFDLAIGVPYENLDDRSDAGAVHVVYGSSDGLTTKDSDFWHQDVSGIDGSSDPGDLFGLALAAGDFDGDEMHELAIGVPLENLDDITNAGVVQVLAGSHSGLTSAGDQTWHQDSSGIEGTAEHYDQFGLALTTGDFDGDGYADLIVGVPYDDVRSVEDAGAVHAIYGSSDGLDSSGDQYLHQDTSGIEGTAETFDLFGIVLAAGDFDDDGRDDLAIGVPAEDVEGATSATNAGVVNVLLGSSSGIKTSGDLLLSQDSSGIRGSSESFDLFGSSLTVGDFNGDDHADLGIGVPLEDVGSNIDAGAVNVIYSSSSGLRSSNDQLWHQDVSGVEGEAEPGDRFGTSVR
jgi:hypothetical protein